MNLKEWRESKGWDQFDLAAKLGKPRPTYQKMEAGTAPIRLKEQEKIRKLGYTGPWPREETKVESAVGLSSTEAAALQREVDLLRKDLKQAERVQYALIGAVRQLAKAAGLSHLAESLE